MDLFQLVEEIRRRRIDKNWSQSDLAKLSKTSRSFIQRIESGKLDGISFLKLLSVLEVLGLDLKLVEREKLLVSRLIEGFSSISADENKKSKTSKNL